jgi:hypothetical protein
LGIQLEERGWAGHDVIWHCPLYFLQKRSLTQVNVCMRGTTR